jgi:O-succinylbenzoic acid--CoA ligase
MVVDLLDAAAGGPDAVALVSDQGRWTYAELAWVVGERADRMRAEGVQPGMVVPIPLDASAESVITLLALWRAGATPAPLNSRLTKVEHDVATEALQGRPSRAQAVLWTSGTEGRPRGVEISFRNLAESARAAQHRLGLDADDVWLASLSPAHVGGLALVTRALLLGCRLVVAGPFDAARTLQLIDGGESGVEMEGVPVTHLSVVPTQLLRLLELRGATSPPETFRCALVGGARAPTRLIERAHSSGWPLALTYGLTEATSQVATAPPDLTRRKPGTVGRPLDGVQVRLTEQGEILVRGATVAATYVGVGATTDADGWHHTGDLGRMDDDGDLWVTGRRADRIVTGGVTVDASEVEEALRAHASVADAAVVGLPDEEWGERLAAWIVPAESLVDLADLQAFLSDRLSKAKLPRVFHVAGELPRNENGKVDRVAVRDAVSRSTT